MAITQRPNVLWLMSDQYHVDRMGHAGRQVRPPNLDSLAARGVRFTEAFCNDPTCAPSRISFITGQYPYTHRHPGNNMFYCWERNANIPAALARSACNKTALFGERHMIRQWDEEGFEHVRYCDLIEADRNDPLSNHCFRHLYDHGQLPENHPRAPNHRFASQIPHAHSLEAWTGNETLRFLREREPRRPVSLQMSFQRPHEPLSLCGDWARLYPPEEVDVPSSARDLFEWRAFTSTRRSVNWCAWQCLKMLPAGQRPAKSDKIV